ncbi:MAG: tetratricopeptide repeat protein [Planctomycetota bacterium]|nr:tetratricopeptide repeat protein [Planctomycetota bacterium]
MKDTMASHWFCLPLCFLIPLFAEDQTNRFDSLLSKVRSVSESGATDAEAQELLTVAVKIGRPFAAHQAIKNYLKNVVSPSSELLVLSARNAEYSGDFRSAVTRYKTYLASATPDAKASDIAARMYEIMIDFLKSYYEAYDFMRRDGHRFRHSIKAKKFDGWFLSLALKRNEYDVVAERLHEVLKTTPAKDRHFYSRYVADYLYRLYRFYDYTESKLKGLQYLKLIPPLVDDPNLSARFAFQAAYMDFYVRRKGSKPEELNALFAPIYQQAVKLFDRFPDRDTAQSIIRTMGAYNQAPEWNVTGSEKNKFLEYAITRMKTEEDQRWIFSTGSPFMGVTIWLKHADRYPWLVNYVSNTSARTYIGYVPRDRYPAIAPKLVNSRQHYALLARAIAAGDDPVKGLDALMLNLWHLDFGAVYKLVNYEYFYAYNQLYGNADRLSGMVTSFGERYLSKGPVPLFDTDASKEFVYHAWRHYTTDIAKLSAALHSLDWVPYSAEERKVVFQMGYETFTKWAEASRKELTLLKAGTDLTDVQKKRIKELDDALLKVNDIDKVFKQVMSVAVNRSGRFPNPLTQKMVEARKAVQAENLTLYVQKAKEIYSLVRMHEARKVPYGRAALKYISSNHKGLETFDLQAYLLEEELKQVQPNQWNSDIGITYWAMNSGRTGWPASSPVGDRPRQKKLNELFKSSFLAQMKRGKYWPWLFNVARTSCRGSGWYQYNWCSEVMEQAILKKSFYQTNHRPFDATQHVTTNYMYLLRHEFTTLYKKYPSQYFDNDYLEESKRVGRFDRRYFEAGYDSDLTIRKFYAAELLKGKDYAPTSSLRGTWYYRSMSTSVRPDIIKYFDKAYGKTRFDGEAMGYGWFNLNTNHNMKLPKIRKEFFDRLNKWVDRSMERPVRDAVPSMFSLSQIKPIDLTDSELDALMRIFHVVPDLYGSRTGYTGYQNYHYLVRTVHEGLIASGRSAVLFQAIPYFWRIMNDISHYPHRAQDTREQVNRYVVGLLEEEKYELAACYSISGLEIANRRLNEQHKITLMNGRSKAVARIGGIPVAKTDPRYPLFEAQVAFLAGNLNSAWKLYKDNKEALEEAYKDLDSGFLVWLVEKNTQLRDFGAAESFAQLLIRWVDSNPEAFDSEVRARLFLSYADIAFYRQEFPRARAQYDRIVATPAFRDTVGGKTASIRIAAVDTLTKNYQQAIERLERIAASQDTVSQVGANYQLAVIKFDQEEYDEAGEFLDRVLLLQPDHADAKILKGRLYLKRKKLIEATEIDLGITTAKRIIIPGKPLKVKLEDRNLSIVGKTTNIEIRAWTTSGDEEIFSLFPFGDSRTRFEGGLPTELGVAEKNNFALQLLGNDKVYYDFSEKFKVSHGIKSTSPIALTVASDGNLQASSSRIPTQKELDEIALRAALKIGARGALSTARAGNLIRPGNPVYMRVTDLDRSTTAEVDRIGTAISTSSGDRVQGHALVETGEATGIFENTVKTAPAQPTAFAPESMEGRSPNFCISPKKYLPWVAEPDNQRPKFYGVDLNDNVPLGKMRIEAAVPGRKLKEFLIQTSYNNKKFTTVGWWPREYKPWLGQLHLEVARAPKLPKDLSPHLEWGYIPVGSPKAVHDLKEFSFHLSSHYFHHDTKGRRLDLPTLYPSHNFVARIRGAFYSPKYQRRSFTLKLSERTKMAKVTFLVDGQSPKDLATPRIELGLEKGVHTIEVTVTGTYRDSVKGALYWDIDKAPYEEPVPASLFTENVEKVQKVFTRGLAKIQPTEDHSAFDIEYPSDISTRILRLIMIDFETDAPAINKIHLTNTAGEKVLPTPQDFAELMKNDILEIIPGDRITVRYKDPKHISRGLDVHERFLSASYNNASLSAAFIEVTRSGDILNQNYIPIVRFKTGEPIVVFINDPDADVSEKFDTVTFTAQVIGQDRKLTLKALETQESSATFVGRIFPSEEEPKRPADLQLSDDDNIMLTYMDRENTDPGIPWFRSYKVRQTFWQDPELRLYDTESAVFEEKQTNAKGKEVLVIGRMLVITRPDDPTDVVTMHASNGEEGEKKPEAPKEEAPPEPGEEPENDESNSGPKEIFSYFDGPIIAEILWPTIALSVRSRAQMYVQTSSGRELVEANATATADGVVPPPFNVNVPGTTLLTTGAGGPGVNVKSTLYQDSILRGAKFEDSPLEVGLFTFHIPYMLGDIQEYSPAADPDAAKDEDKEHRGRLRVRGGDSIFVGFQYVDEAEKEHWLTGSFKLKSDYDFHILDRRYEKKLAGIHVGETLYFRVIDKSKDVGGERDEISITLATAGGSFLSLPLKETFEHTGEFRGLLRPVYAEQGQDIADNQLGVTYGDTITVTYGDENDIDKVVRTVEVFKGANGSILSFTKRFKDPEIAAQTQFTIAEAYFELAKKHRKLGQKDLSKQEIEEGKRLLEEASRDFPNTETKAQADYLLANLSLEFAEETEDAKEKQQLFNEAVNRFSDIVASNPEGSYAPKSQYKKALVFEKMGLVDRACEEYVKLSYRYPDNELVAETISRLGQYFWQKGRELRKAAAVIEEEVERLKQQQAALNMYRTSGEVFGRLSSRFPTHKLAARTSVLSGQAYIQAEDYDKSIEILSMSVKKYEDDKVACPEAMYWLADSYTRRAKQKDMVEAYRTFKKLTWDFPASKWAKYARGRLVEDKMAGIEEQALQGEEQ